MTLLMFCTVVFNACTKTIDEQVKNMGLGKSQNSPNARLVSGDATRPSSDIPYDDIINLDNPERDVIQYLKNGGKLPDTKHFKDFLEFFRNKMNKDGLTISQFPYNCGNDLVILGYPGAPSDGCPTGGEVSRKSNVAPSTSIWHNEWCPTYITDAWYNKIYALAMYGNDPRQGYYVYLPDNFNANSKIVVLVHGGSWISGPNPDVVNGWGSAYAPNDPNDLSSANKKANNIVKNLVAQGYVVVSILYRLVSYGDNNSDIMSTPITIKDQVNDIDAAIQHVHDNFPGCLGINANNIQVLGESAGANLALLYAYTKANTGYIKSVISVAGPTNMNQFANWIKTPPFVFNCGNDFVLADPNATIFTHFPYYSFYDPSAPNANLITTSLINPLTCTVAGIRLNWLVPPFGIFTAPNNINKRITNSFRLAQSCIRQIITTPSITTEFNNISPCVAINTSRIVPTFIIHGTDDWLVPYSKATNTMSTGLSTYGGLINTINSGNSVPSTYTSGNKHLIKLYTNANHNVSDFQNPLTNNGPSETQIDIIAWLNGH